MEPIAVTEAAIVWLRIESQVRKLSPGWLARAGYYTVPDDYGDVVAEARLRFLKSFSPRKASGVSSTIAYARRCCLSARRGLSPSRDLIMHAVREVPELLTVSCNIGIEEKPEGAPGLADLSPVLNKRIKWFAAHPKMVSVQVLSRLRREISAYIQTASGHATHPTGINISESCRGRRAK